MVSARKTILIDLLRHGEPEGGAILRGRLDQKLTDAGWQQMRRAALGNDSSAGTGPWSELVASPLKRCQAFAQQLSGQLRLPLTIDPVWQEIDYGDWDGLPLEQWRQLAAPQFKAFRKDVTALQPPGGEPFVAFRERVLGAWQQLASRPDGSHLLVITHGGVLRVILPTVLGMPLNHSYPLHIPFACYSRVRLEVSKERVSASLLFHNRHQDQSPGQD